MLLPKFLALVGGLLACLTVDATAGTVSMKVEKADTHSHPALQRRADPFNVVTGNAIAMNFYYVNVSVGTPPQNLQLILDTGSSDIWFFGPNSCNQSAGACLGGTFDMKKSTSAASTGMGAFNISYVSPGSGVRGDYFLDNFAIGPVTVRNTTMAVASYSANVPMGILGIDYNTRESWAQRHAPYPSVIDNMYTQGLIGTRAYSLWLDDLGASSGTILFGGYDSAKWMGNMTVLPIQLDADTNSYSSMSVAWTSISITTSSGIQTVQSADFPVAAVLDSGTTLTLVPPDILAAVVKFLGARYLGGGEYVVACNVANYKGSINYGFGGVNGALIMVPFSEVVLPLYSTTGQRITDSTGAPVCVLGLAAAGTGTPLLFGDTFLRSAYVIYNLDTNTISIAQTNFNPTGSNVRAIDPVPSAGGTPLATSVVSSITALQTASGSVVPGLVGSVAATISTSLGVSVGPGLQSASASASSAATTSGIGGASVVSASAASSSAAAAAATTTTRSDAASLLRVGGPVVRSLVVLGLACAVWWILD